MSFTYKHVAILAVCLCVLSALLGFLFVRNKTWRVPVIYPNVLSSHECMMIIREAETKGFDRSTVVGNSGSTVESTRTSSTVFLDKNSPASKLMAKKVHDITGIDPGRYEVVQVIKYKPGEEYKAHFDACYGCDSGKSMPRTDTVIMYLNDDFEGGGTYFPIAKFRVDPSKGAAAWWKNMDWRGKIYESSKHAGEPVLRGVKYAANIWIRRRPCDVPNYDPKP
jgi:prolyl 4-hydroxylase